MDGPTYQHYSLRAKVFKALGHPARLRFVEALSSEPLCVCELQKLAGSDMSTVSKHLAVLREAGVVIDEKRGNQVFYSLAMPCIRDFLHCVDSSLSRHDPARGQPAAPSLPDLRRRED